MHPWAPRVITKFARMRDRVEIHLTVPVGARSIARIRTGRASATEDNKVPLWDHRRANLRFTRYRAVDLAPQGRRLRFDFPVSPETFDPVFPVFGIYPPSVELREGWTNPLHQFRRPNSKRPQIAIVALTCSLQPDVVRPVLRASGRIETENAPFG